MTPALLELYVRARPVEERVLMHLADLLLDLEYRQIELFVKEGALGYRAPPGALTDSLVEQLKCHRQELIDLMQTDLVQDKWQSSYVREHGEIPLTPSHGWYLETFNPAIHRWMVKCCVRFGKDVRFDLAGQAVHLLMNRYDTFRQRYFRRRDGRWGLRMLDTPGDPKFVCVDLTKCAEERMQETEKDLQRTISIVDGPVVYAALFKNSKVGDELIIWIHHSIVDGYSLDPLTEDVVEIYERLLAGQDVERRVKTECSYAAYTEALHRYMGGPMFLARSLSYWGDFAKGEAPARIPVDFPDGVHIVSNSRKIRFFVSPDDLPSSNTSLINDALLIAAVGALAHWSGAPRVTIDFEHHGRGGHVPGMEFLNVMGPTTLKFPMRFDIGPQSLASPASFAALRKRIVDTTWHSLGEGFLRYIHPNPQVQSRFQNVPRPQIFFNNRVTLQKVHRGEAAEPVRSSSGGFVRDETHGHPKLHDPYSHELLIECDRSWEGVEISLTYSGMIHKDETIFKLAEVLLSKLKQISTVCV